MNEYLIRDVRQEVLIAILSRSQYASPLKNHIVNVDGRVATYLFHGIPTIINDGVSLCIAPEGFLNRKLDLLICNFMNDVVRAVVKKIIPTVFNDGFCWGESFGDPIHKFPLTLDLTTGIVANTIYTQEECWNILSAKWSNRRVVSDVFLEIIRKGYIPPSWLIPQIQKRLELKTEINSEMIALGVAIFGVRKDGVKAFLLKIRRILKRDDAWWFADGFYGTVKDLDIPEPHIIHEIVELVSPVLVAKKLTESTAS